MSSSEKQENLVGNPKRKLLLPQFGKARHEEGEGVAGKKKEVRGEGEGWMRIRHQMAA